MGNKTRKEKLNEILMSLEPQEVMVLNSSLRNRLSSSEDNQEILKDTIHKIESKIIRLKSDIVWGKVTIGLGDEDKLIELLQAQLLDAENEEKHVLSIIKKFTPLNELFEQMSVQDTDMNNTFEKTGYIYDSLQFDS